MNHFLLVILILLLSFTPACSSPEGQYVELELHEVEAGDNQSILIQVDHGEVTIMESSDDRMKIEGQVLSADDLEYQVSSAEKQISVKVFAHRYSLSTPPLIVSLHIPKQLRVRVETDSASLHTQDYQGDLEVASTSGDIAIGRMTGRLTLRSNRGDIIVRESTGDIAIAGNYGAIKIQNVSGDTAASTIMGNIDFSGLIHEGDNVRLETDHGGVSVDLNQVSTLTVQVHSASGYVACILPGISSTMRTCGGEFNSGGGTLSIRTVSGSVTLELIP